MKKCLVCGNEFVDTTISHNKLYCSPQCKGKINRQQFKSSYPDYYKEREKLPQRIAYKKIYNKSPQYKSYQKKYIQTTHYKISQPIYRKKYNQSEKGKEWRRKWTQSEMGKAILNVAHKKYHQTEKGKATDRRYAERNREKLNKKVRIWGKKNPEKVLRNRRKYYHTEKGKVTILRVLTKRERNMSFNPITNNPFPREVRTEWHHINNMFVAPTPKRLHRHHKGKSHRFECNRILQNFGFNLKVFT